MIFLFLFYFVLFLFFFICFLYVDAGDAGRSARARESVSDWEKIQYGEYKWL